MLNNPNLRQDERGNWHTRRYDPDEASLQYHCVEHGHQHTWSVCNDPARGKFGYSACTKCHKDLVTVFNNPPHPRGELPYKIQSGEIEVTGYLNDPNKLASDIASTLKGSTFGDKYELPHDPIGDVEDIAKELAEEYSEKCDELNVHTLAEKLRLFGRLTLDLVLNSFDVHNIDDFVTAVFIEKLVSQICKIEASKISEREAQADAESAEEYHPAGA